jgi:hypothetical protein
MGVLYVRVAVNIFLVTPVCSLHNVTVDCIFVRIIMHYIIFCCFPHKQRFTFPLCHDVLKMMCNEQKIPKMNSQIIEVDVLVRPCPGPPVGNKTYLIRVALGLSLLPVRIK